MMRLTRVPVYEKTSIRIGVITRDPDKANRAVSMLTDNARRNQAGPLIVTPCSKFMVAPFLLR